MGDHEPRTRGARPRRRDCRPTTTAHVSSSAFFAVPPTIRRDRERAPPGGGPGRARAADVLAEARKRAGRHEPEVRTTGRMLSSLISLRPVQRNSRAARSALSRLSTRRLRRRFWVRPRTNLAFLVVKPQRRTHESGPPKPRVRRCTTMGRAASVSPLARVATAAALRGCGRREIGAT